ncbi:MAG: valine--tRNA ligase [Myxococcota bacterium]|nr:valine--tRNA ligase [Myxococcota bacterium]MDW8362835.1 valine--tRNA ligase [Myxococcales bacterium]
MSEMPKAYEPAACETRWYEFWERSGFFRASGRLDDPRRPYTIAIPPPNVTGSLHMGHACRTTYEDVLIRHRRMCGRDALWIPGTDHAGIATQLVVERQLRREGLSRHDLGRQAFVERVWRWKAESGGTILRQLRRLGASCDWSRERFTMDEGLSRAVREAFVRLYEQGLVYRAHRLIHWCVDCRTALSDLEVEAEENVEGTLFDFAYPLEDGSGEIVVSTTRPETMLGDTGIAVHPDDPRHRHLIGRHARHPFVERRLPIVADAELVDPTLGTGAVKLTPAHDPNDFAAGKRHGLEEISVIEPDGRMGAHAGPFAGLERFEARRAVERRLEELGLARGRRAHRMTLPRCQRCRSVIEPLLSVQWFVRMQPLAAPAIEAVESGRIRILPEEWTKTYFHWMRNIQDWCVSRQLWWGHPIPAWYCEQGHVTVARADPARCAHCDGAPLQADPDVLDTWFSSALWPFSTLGWPDTTVDLRRYYPTDDMETGFDILFFWVARMIMMGLHFMGDVPFRRVLLGGLVTDERGEKMSKVRGNVVDPLDVIDGASLEQLLDKARAGGASAEGLEYIRKTYPQGFAAFGADALRMTLLSYAPQSRKIALSLKRVEGYRHFANKLWNAARYTLGALEGSGVHAAGRPDPVAELPNRWILSRLAVALDEAERGLEEYRLDEASRSLYRFVWDELCDWYLEMSKTLLRSGDPVADETRRTLAHVLDVAVRALHPMMPFVTEEIWQRIPRADGGPTVMLAPYPSATRDGRPDVEADTAIAAVVEATVAIRAARADADVHPGRRIDVSMWPSDETSAARWKGMATLAGALCNGRIEVHPPGNAPPAATTTAVVATRCGTFHLLETVDPARERSRLERELARLGKELEGLERRLASPDFVARAPAEVVEAQRARRVELDARRTELRAALARLSG